MKNEGPNQSPEEAMLGKAASLDVNGALVAKGRVCFYANPDRGKFWPDDPIRLETPVAQGTLPLVGTSVKIRVQNVHQCFENPWHWDFIIAGQR